MEQRVTQVDGTAISCATIGALKNPLNSPSSQDAELTLSVFLVSLENRVFFN